MASVGSPIVGLYSATKAAEEQLSRSWAAEFGPRGVRFNVVSPGVTRTPINDTQGDLLDQIAAGTPPPAGPSTPRTSPTPWPGSPPTPPPSSTASPSPSTAASRPHDWADDASDCHDPGRHKKARITRLGPRNAHAIR